MSDQSTKLFYPAPNGLPVPVRPPRGSGSTLVVLREAAPNPLVAAGALWLHGFIDEAHKIAQDIDSREGSYWHALVHRSEGDFDNSKYWFGRVGSHPIFGALRSQVDALAGESGPTPITQDLPPAIWDPLRFVDLCARAHAGGFGDAGLLARVAALEYNLLMAHILGKKNG
jgi:hypothetical protein